MSKNNQYKEDAIPTTKEKILEKLIVLFLAVGFPLLLVSLIRVFTLGWRPVFAIQLLLFLILLFVYGLRRKISLNLKTSIIIGILFAISINGIYYFGFLGTGKLFLILAVVVSGFFFGKKHAYIFLVVSLLIIATFAYLYTHHILSYNFDVLKYVKGPATWISYLVTIVFIILTLLLIIHMLEDAYLGLLRIKSAQEESYRILFEQSADGIIIFNSKGEIVLSNQSFSKITGFSNSELTGKNISELFIEGVPETRVLHSDLIESGEVVVREQKSIRKDNVTIDVETRTHKLPDGRIQSVFRDVTEIKRIRSEIDLEREMNEKILEIIPGIFFIYEHDGINSKLIKWNSNHAKMMGYTSEELRGMLVKDFFLNDKQEKLESWLKNIYDEKEFIVQTEILHKNGEAIPYILIARAFKMYNRYMFLGVGMDVSEQKKQEEALKASEERYHTLFDNANDAIFVMKDKKFIECNAKTLVMFGCKKEEIINKEPYVFSPKFQPSGELSEKLASEYIKATFEGIPQFFEWKHSKISGELFDAEVSLNRIILDNQNFLLAIVREITDRKKAEIVLRESEEKFRNIFNSTSDSIFILDLNFKFIAANKAFFKLTGFNENELTSINLFELVVDEDAEELIKERTQQLIKNKSSQHEYTIRDKKGVVFMTDARGQLITFNGKPGLLISFNDISERKRLEKQVLISSINAEENERGRLARELHDGLGPLLSAFRIYLYNIKKKYKNDSDIKNLDELINEALVSIQEISNNISPHILRNYGLDQALRSFIEKIRGRKGLRIVYSSSLDKRYDETIETSLYRVVTELINNTLKYADAREVKIVFEQCEEILTIEYVDDGIGFNYNEAIVKHKGFGLLNIHSRIASLGGRIDFQSRLGEGVKVKIQIRLI